MNSNLLSFDDTLNQNKGPQERLVPVAIPNVSSQLNPYQDSACPKDIYDYLLPDGSPFGLYADPYATMFFHKPKLGLPNAKFWLDDKLADGNFTQKEIKLFELLSSMRLATRRQIQRAIFPRVTNDEIVVEFIKKFRKVGIICAFSWVSPLKDGRKKPLVYAFTKVGAEAAEIVLQRKLPESFWFQPVEFELGQGPDMNEKGYFLDLIAHELHCELLRVDRLISWQRLPRFRMPNGAKDYQPNASFDIIKDKNEFRNFWVEIFRPHKGWMETTVSRFQKIQIAFQNLTPSQRPNRILVITDGDARIPILTQVAEQYMPEIIESVRFTTDERLLKGLDKDTLITWDRSKNQLVASNIAFFLPDYHGMTASEYLSEQKADFDLDEDYEE